MARVACVVPGEPVRRHTVVVGGPAAAFCVDHLQPASRYEARVSYPASHPAAMSVGVERWPSGTQGVRADPGTRGAARRLLNAEKAVFDTDERGVPILDDGGVVATGSAVVIVVRAAPEGVRPGTADAAQSAKLRPTAVPFSLVLDALHAGVVPHTAVRMGLVLCAAVLLVLCGVVPYLLSTRSPWGIANVERRRVHQQ